MDRRKVKVPALSKINYGLIEVNHPQSNFNVNYNQSINNSISDIAHANSITGN